ncbi:hypothetical protein MMC25_008134 [Agyrium rufum]|nr:hypothetical protein [Agyrium rufum]
MIAPARGALEYEAHSFDVEPTYLEDGTINPNHNNRFVGEPNPELYVAWNELLQYQNIRLSYDELGERRDEPGTIALPDGGYGRLLKLLALSSLMQSVVRQAIPLGSDTGRHECAKWEKLDDWMKERSFNPMEPGYLDHPSLGPAFPDGEGDAVGIIVDHAMHDD